VARSKYWLEGPLGIPILPASTTGFQQQNTAIFTPNPGDTLMRTRVDFQMTTQIQNFDTMLAYDPGWVIECNMWFGVYATVESFSDTPPSLIDHGGAGIDWIMWDAVSPRIEFAPTVDNDLQEVITWSCNGGVTMDSFSRRASVVDGYFQIWLCLGYYDNLELLSRLTSHLDASTIPNISAHCLFEAVAS